MLNLLRSPVTTKDEVKIVAAQKNVGGCVSVYVKATIHGKSPLEKFPPPNMRPELIFGIPQVSVFLFAIVFAEIQIAKKLIRTKMLSIVDFIIEVKGYAEN